MDYAKVAELTHSLLAKAPANYRLIDCIDQLRGKDEYSYTHSINVSIYAMLLALDMLAEIMVVRMGNERAIINRPGQRSCVLSGWRASTREFTFYRLRK